MLRYGRFFMILDSQHISIGAPTYTFIEVIRFTMLRPAIDSETITCAFISFSACEFVARSHS